MGYNRVVAIQSAAAQLTALTGVAPRIVTEPGAMRIEIDVTEALIRHWRCLLPVLDLGTEFGLTDTDTGRQVAWLRIELSEGANP